MATAPGKMDMPSNQGAPMREPGDKQSVNSGKTSGASAPAMDKNPSKHQATADQLTSNPKLSANLQELFPPGASLSSEAAGFKNLGDFVAAAHVSHNLGIPFADLKGKVTGGTSLGQAIHELRPDANAKAETARAKEQAKKTLHDSGS